MLPFDRSYGKQNDESLVELTCQGRPEALELFLSIHQRLIYNISLRMLNDEEKARQLTEGSMVKILLNIRKAAASEDVRVWIYRMVVAEIKKTIDETPDTIDEVTERFGNGKISAGCLFGMLRLLSVEHRFIFVLAGVFEIPGPILSEILELSSESVNQGLTAGKEILCRSISKNYPSPGSVDHRQLIRLYKNQPFSNRHCAGRLVSMLCRKTN